MKGFIEILNELDETDIDWILSQGHEQQVIANTHIIKQGQSLDSIYIVLEGLLGIRIASVNETQLHTLGPGEIIGEMSFLKEQPASATVYAVENSLLLVLARTKLDAKLERDPLFAARLYRSIAVVISRRLKRTGDALGDMLSNRSTVTLSVANRWKEISTHIDAFKDLMQQADTAAIQNFDTVPKELAEKVETSFGSFLQFLNTQIGDNSADHVSVRDVLGVQVKREILPYLLLTRTAERFYSKPRGYAGDFMTIEMIYKNQPQGTGRIGALLD